MNLAYFLFVLVAFVPTGFSQKAETMTIKLYFHNGKYNPDQDDCTKVFPVTRKIPKTAAVATAALAELFKVPTNEEAAQQYSAFEPSEKTGILKSVKVRDGAAYVNFTGKLFDQMGNITSSCGGGFFSMVGATLRQFPTIKKVYYAVEGNTNDFYEWVQIGECPYGKKICAASNF